jgi:hypothetical protein
MRLRPKRSRKWGLAALGAAALVFSGEATAQPATARAAAPVAPATLAAGPRALAITYRAEARNRPAFRRYLAGPMTRRLRALKAQRVIADYRIYYSLYVQPNVWDAMLVLRFPDFGDVARWNAIERDSPGGLDAGGLALARPDMTVPADVEWTSPDPAERDRIYYILPYEYQNAAEYRQYIPGYLLPQLKGWMQDGALAGYDILMNRYPVGPSWDSLVILKYRDLESFGRRQTVLDRTRVGLREDKVWNEWSDRKAKIRDETENSIAELLPQ